MNAIDFLTAQHRKVEAMLSKIEATEGLKAKRALYEEMADSLAAHVTIEETQFYPAVKAKRTEDKLLEAAEEHLGIKRLLTDLLRLSAADETFAPKIKVLKEQVVHHHGEEEEDLFPKVSKMLGKDELDALGQNLSAEFESLLASTRPREDISSETTQAASI